jgi:putative tryptophan/tyrosine transport system substrate-binding protein
MVGIKRRDFITLLGGAAAWPLAANAQHPPQILRVGAMSLVNPRNTGFWTNIEKGLNELGWVDGKNLAVEYIVAPYEEGMKELARRKVDLIVAFGPEPALKAAIEATKTSQIRIVMVAIDFDPIARGYVAGLRRSGERVTGLFFQQIEQSKKRVEWANEAFPNRPFAALWDRYSADQWQAAQDAASMLGVRLTGIELREPPYDYEAALAQAASEQRGALIVTLSPVFFSDRYKLAEFALAHRLPSIFGLREFVDAGGLMSFGVSFAALGRRAAAYVDRIAKGTDPADLPIEQPTKFELVINLKTARALGLTVPASLVVRADEVIE